MSNAPNTTHTTPTGPADGDEAARLAHAARLAEADAQADAEWRASFHERFQARCAEVDAERRAMRAARAKKAAAVRWRNGKGAPTAATRIYAGDLATLRRFVWPWMGRYTTPAEAVHRLLEASKGLLWQLNAEGYVHPVGPLRDVCCEADKGGA